MEKIENAPRNEAQDDVIVLGVASVETMGSIPGNTEAFLLRVTGEISEE